MSKIIFDLLANEITSQMLQLAQRTIQRTFYTQAGRNAEMNTEIEID